MIMLFVAASGVSLCADSWILRHRTALLQGLAHVAGFFIDTVGPPFAGHLRPLLISSFSCFFTKPSWWKLVHKFCQQVEAKSSTASADDEQAIKILAAHLRALAASRQLQWNFRGWTAQQRRDAVDRFVGLLGSGVGPCLMLFSP